MNYESPCFKCPCTCPTQKSAMCFWNEYKCEKNSCDGNKMTLDTFLELHKNPTK